MGAFHNEIELGDEHDRPRPDLTYKQLRANELLQRLKMAWVALWFVLILFSIAMLAFWRRYFSLRAEVRQKPF
jgi:hypothetical protein